MSSPGRKVPSIGFRSWSGRTNTGALLHTEAITVIAHQREATVPAKFTLTKDKAGKFRFSLLAANGAVVATSAAYGTKASALNGLASVRKNAAGAALEDTTIAKTASKTASKTAARTAKTAAKTV